MLNLKHSQPLHKREDTERDLLGKLNIPAVSLENFGCPKAASLFDDWTGWRHVNILGG